MSKKMMMAASMLCMASAADAAVLFTISGTMDPAWGSDFFSVPQFAYNTPLLIEFQLSRLLVAGEYLEIDQEYSVEWHQYKDGSQSDYDYYHFILSDLFTLVSEGSIPAQNYYSYNSWYEDDWDGTHFFEEKYWTTLEYIWLDNMIFTPFDWTITISGAIPEPATWAMLIGGFGLVGLTMRRRRAAAA